MSEEFVKKQYALGALCKPFFLAATVFLLAALFLGQDAQAYGANDAARSGKYIDINLTKQTLSIFEGGKLLNTYRVSTGKRSMPTPVGTYHIQNKVRRAWSAKYGLFMPWWMAITPSGSMGIHELPEWPNGTKEGSGHLGIPVSHGCIRLGVGPAKRVYDWADIGTLVVVHK